MFRRYWPLTVVGFAAAVAGILLWQRGGTRESPAAPPVPLPDLRVEAHETVDQFLEQFDSPQFRAVGLLKATSTSRNLELGWSRKWLDLPKPYRQKLVRRIGETWALYYGGATSVFAIPIGNEIARFEPGKGTSEEDAGR